MATLADVRQTPGKADDVFFQIGCFGKRLGDLCDTLRTKYVDPTTGEFQELDFNNLASWSTLINDLHKGLDVILEECFGGDATLHIKNDLLLMVLKLIGVDVVKKTAA